MKQSRWIAVLGLFAVAILLASPVSSLADEAAKTETATYLITSPHTMEECLASLDEVAASGENAIDNWYWGCKYGDHTGYEIVQAASKEAAMKTVPENLRAKAHIYEVGKFTEEQIASLHEQMEKK